ncbi:MAG: class II aldolase/adducin family protein [Lachnospiraceae bacterium]
MTEDKVKAQIVDIVKKEYQMHMVNLFEGNVSARMEDRVWVTPSQVSKEEMTEDMLIEMDLSGHILKCPAGFRPSSETGMHLEVYRLCPDVQAVLHNHSTYATAYAVNHMPIPAGFLTEVDMFFGEIPVTPYGKPGTAEVYKVFYQYLPGKKALLLANHGVLTMAETVPLAFSYAEAVEKAAKTLYIAGRLGTLQPIR